MFNVSKAEARTFTIATVGGAAFIWDIAFNLGVYDTIFFEKIFVVWAASLAVFWVSIVLPDEHAPVSWWGRVILILPTVWVILALITEPTDITTTNGVMLWIGLGIYVACLPYTLYVITTITNPEFFAFKSPRLGVALALILLLISITSFLVGRNNHLFLTCEDFKVSGNDIPPTCVQGPSLDTLLE